MRCDDAGRFLGAYLDSELDPKTSLEIAGHLEQCTGCRERFAAEGRLERAILTQAAKPEPGDEGLWQQALSRARRSRRSRWAWAAGIAAVAALALLVWKLAPEKESLAADIRKDYQEYRSGQWTLDIVSSESKAVEAYFQERMGLAVSVPSKLGDLTLVGGRKCSLRGVPTAFLLYRREGADISLFIFSANQLDHFPATGGIQDPLVDEKGEVPVVAVRSDWKVVCATGPVTSSELASLCRALGK